MSEKNIEELFLIGSEINHSKILKMIKEAQQKENSSYIVISTNLNSDNSLTKHHIQHETGNIYLTQDQESIEDETRNWVSKWVFRSGSIFDTLNYRQNSFWWFIDRRIRFEIFEIFFQIKILQGIEKNLSPRKIIWYDESGILENLIPQVFSSSEKFLEIKPKFSFRVKKNILMKFKWWFGVYFLFLREKLFELWGKIISRIYSLNKEKIDSCVAIITNSVSWRSYYNKNTNQFELGDYYFENITNELRKHDLSPIVEIFKVNDIRKDLKVVKAKNENAGGKILVIFDTYNDKNAKKQYKKELSFFKQQYNKLEQELITEEVFLYSEIVFSNIIRKRILWYLKAYIPLGLKWKATFNSLIKIINPKVILFINEFFTFGKALTLCARENINVSSFALQHGFFTELDIGSNKPVDYQDDPTFVPPLTPDKTFVYGPYYEQLLLKLGYDKKNVIISGNPTYDSLSALMDKINNEDIIKKLNLSPNKKIIVFGTQPDFFETAIAPIHTLISFANQQSNIQLIIKVHPREDLSQYEFFKKEAKIPVRIIKDQNILSILKICDVFISQHSTTILDALVVGKPVGVVNFTKRQSSLRFLKSEGILELNTPEQLVKVTHQILEDPEFLFKYEKFLQEFLTEHAFKVDGKASERIVETIINQFKH